MNSFPTLGLVLAATATALSLSIPPALAQRECTPFPQARMAATRMGPHSDLGLFTAGNFRPVIRQTKNNEDEIQDFAFVSTTATSAGPKSMLSVMISSDFGCFTKALPTKVVAGDKPVLMAAGRIDDDDRDDIAIVDGHVDPFNTPKIRIFIRGTNEGDFTQTAVIPLPRGETPVALALGLFREPKVQPTKGMPSPPKKPLDIALVSAALDLPAIAQLKGRGVVRLFRNNGKGGFEQSPPIVFSDFQPASMLASDSLRDGGHTDLVIKEAIASGTKNRVLYLKNAGNGTFADIITLLGGGDMPSFQLGKLRKDNVGDNLDIVTFDSNMTVKIFKNVGLGAFRSPSDDPDSQTIVRWNKNSEFGFADTRKELLVADFRDKQLQLRAVAKRQSGQGTQVGMLTLSFKGGPTPLLDFREVPSLTIETPNTDRGDTDSTTVTGDRPAPQAPVLAVIGGIVAQFASASSGNKGPVFGIVARHVVTETAESACGSPVAAKPVPFVPKKKLATKKEVFAKRCIGLRPVCIDGKPICSGPMTTDGACECTCPQDPPFQPDEPTVAERQFCRTASGFPVLIVFDN